MADSVPGTEPTGEWCDVARSDRAGAPSSTSTETVCDAGLVPTAEAPAGGAVSRLLPETEPAEPAQPDETATGFLEATRQDGDAQSAIGLPSTAPEAFGSSRTREWRGRARISRGQTIRAGEVIADFELIEELGHGGMGVVFRARHRAADRVVALKMIRPELIDCREPDRLDSIFSRFRVEAQAAARLAHDHIVTVYDVGESAGRPYYSMRLIEGTSLAEMLEEGPLSNEHAARIFEPIARAVHSAHASGIVHRDIKPSNILVDGAGRPYVADFGLAKWLSSDTGLTASGERLGTPCYMSPEQAGGESPVGAAGDVYSLGATLYHALTGRPPFRAADPVETMRQVIDQEPVPPRKLNRAVARDMETICLKCLEKRPADRFTDALAVAKDLSLYIEGKPIHARPAGPLERLVKWARLRPAAAGLVLVCLMVAAGGTGAVVWEREQSRARRIEALIEALETGETARVPQVVRELAELQPKSGRRVSARLKQVAAGSLARFNLGLAAVDGDPSVTGELVERMLVAPPYQVAVIRDSLRGQITVVSARLRDVLGDAGTERGRRLRAACGLAAYDVNSPQLKDAAADIASWLIAAENRFLLGDWLELLRGIRGELIGPLSSAFKESERHDERDSAAFALASYVDQVPPLLELLGAGEGTQNAVLIEKLRGLAGRAPDGLEAKLVSALESEPKPRAPATGAALRRISNYALALLALEHGESVWPLLGHSDDDSLRTEMINRAAEAGVSASTIVRRAESEKDPSIRLALLLVLGEYPLSRLSQVERDRVKPWLRRVYANDQDPGIHSAARWLLLRWGDRDELARADAALASNGPVDGRRWYVGRNGHTMAVVRGPVEFVMGSHETYPDRHDETLHRVRIVRTYSIATLEATFGQYSRFEPSAAPASNSPHGLDHPIDNRSYVDCVAYCRWLTAQEGMSDERQMCYPPVETFVRDGMRPYPDYLERPGYRLPTEAEWEFACRAGSSTGRPFGRFDDHVAWYAWWLPVSSGDSHPVGLKKPNDLGLFDMLGNLSEWCSDSYARYGTTMTDPAVEDQGLAGNDHPQRVLRGGAYFSSLAAVRSAARSMGHGVEGVPFFGFRVARTLPSQGDR